MERNPMEDAMITKISMCLLPFLVVIFFMTASVHASATPQVGGQLPDFDLKTPENPEERNYLGLTGEGTFKIPQIKADVVIVEIFSMYCPHCQREAPTMNDFYNRIESSEQLRGRVKIIGIGVGNSDFEVDFFRKQYKVSFPLFSDGDYTIHKLIGEVRTPYFFGITIQSDGAHRIFYSKLGGAKDTGGLLEEILRKAELKE
jgi:peroxiredoxin